MLLLFICELSFASVVDVVVFWGLSGTGILGRGCYFNVQEKKDLYENIVFIIELFPI
jgi:hypothetical protein